MQERVFPRVAILPALNQPATHSSGHLCRALHFNPYHHSVPQRQRFPRFGAVVADRCGKAGIGAAAVFATGRDVDREAKCVRQKGTVHEKRDNQAGKDTDSKKRTVGRLWETGPVERAWAGTNASVDEIKALLCEGGDVNWTYRYVVVYLQLHAMQH